MSWSLRIRNGDLDVSNAQLDTVRGSQKLVQDFRCAILEALGHDELHPEWGSAIEGGNTAGGSYSPGVIGSDPTRAGFVIESEIRRIGALLQTRQLNRVQAERLTYNKATITASEILVGIANIRIRQTLDSVDVLVTLQTGSNTLVDVAVTTQSPVGT